MVCLAVVAWKVGTPAGEAPPCAAGQAVGAAGNGQGWRRVPALAVRSLMVQNTATPADDLLQRSSWVQWGRDRLYPYSTEVLTFSLEF